SCYFSLLFLYCSCPLRALHSFPTRRSSDLFGGSLTAASCAHVAQRRDSRLRSAVQTRRPQYPHAARCSAQASLPHTGHSSTSSRSEEHTSELQSRSDLVCRLLLEKKKKKKK